MKIKVTLEVSDKNLLKLQKILSGVSCELKSDKKSRKRNKFNYHREDGFGIDYSDSGDTKVKNPSFQRINDANTDGEPYNDETDDLIEYANHYNFGSIEPKCLPGDNTVTRYIKTKAYINISAYGIHKSSSNETKKKHITMMLNEINSNVESPDWLVNFNYNFCYFYKIPKSDITPNYETLMNVSEIYTIYHLYRRFSYASVFHMKCEDIHEQIIRLKKLAYEKYNKPEDNEAP